MLDSTTRGYRGDWPRKRFHEVADIDGGLVSPMESTFKHLPHIGPENIESGTGRITDVRTADELGLISGKYRFDADSIVYSKIRPNLNKVATPTFSGLCSADAYVIRPKEDIVSKNFLACYLRSHAFLEQAIAVSARTGMPKVNQEDLNRLWVAVPPIQVQQHIASADMYFADARRLTIDLAAAKRHFTRGLMQELLTGQRRYSECRADPWTEASIGDLFEEVKRPIEWDDSASYDLLSIRRHSGGVFLRSRMLAKDIATKVMYEAHEGDILISKMQVVHGAIGIARPEHHGMKISGSYLALRPRAGAPIVPAFFAWLTRLPHMYRAALLSSYGVHIEKMTFNLEWYFRTVVSLPGVAVQQRIVELLDLCERDEKQLEHLAVALDRQKRALLDKLMSGAIRVPAT